MTDRKKSSKGDSRKKYDVEHSLGMYAYSYVQLPAAGLYDKEALEPFKETIETCHIYFIGFLPRVSISDWKQSGRTVSIDLEYLGKRKTVSWDFPDDVCLKEEDGCWFVEASDGQRYAPTDDMILSRLAQQHEPIKFDVRYIGQSFGRDGSRSALDRLQSHETLQKIALKQPPEGYQIALLLVALQPENQLMTAFNPNAEEKDQGGARIRAGLDKLFGTTDRERVSLYEAAMIRYFQPEFNIEFKDSFPSTRLKVLQDCYEKDFSAVSAEFYFDDIPFVLCSEKVAASHYHLAFHDLHTEEDRRAFFSL